MDGQQNMAVWRRAARERLTGRAASRRPPGVRVNLASSLEVRSSVQAQESNVTHHEGAHFFRGQLILTWLQVPI